ncbi:ankyrin [Morchella conica CCBAS932]|uniref:Ankyrin n=1 Tax=Morchella conica CCBAS932 TaxID=1392247 RepID=A0A3N4L9C8_9PEZI|nr:ankyrin [Morchella conica CCBAS932]
MSTTMSPDPMSIVSPSSAPTPAPAVTPRPKTKRSSASQLRKQSLAEEVELPTVLPEIPVPVRDFLKHVEENPGVPIRELLAPYLEYETALRAYFAQKPEHEFVQGNVNLISLFKGDNARLAKIRARNLAQETKEEREKYIMALKDEDRKASGEHFLVESLKEFRDNLNVFSEGSLLNMDWSNVVVAGSAVLTPLLKVPEEYAESKRSLREYYHQKLAPASDIDLFIHGIEEPEEAIKKMEQIERTIKDNILWETTTLRTRNTITIVSQYPNRHVQIVLRLYKSPSQILTGFDVNCSCFAYDGTNVLANPRALGACMTQCNDIDLTRRSPSYENRLSKYSHRGFEVYCDFLDRSRIDPTIFERSFQKTVGLARLLVLEVLPSPEDRESYVIQRRQEMGRPQKEYTTGTPKDEKDLKQRVNDEVAEWDFEDISSYQKFSIPYGEKYNAKRIEKLFYKKDLLLNAEWNPMNKPPHREVALHRHPVFFGNMKDIVVDCCGFCPEPADDEERKIYEEESQIYVSGPITFLHDDPGRQEIGSFYPLGPEDYMDMAYVGSTELLCQAIVEGDVEYVKNWVSQEGVDVNCRDFCGRTPLHLACISAGTVVEVIQVLVDAGARLVARLQDGRTALHLAAASGRLDIVKILLARSLKNQEEKDERDERRAEVEKTVKGEDPQNAPSTQSDGTDLVMGGVGGPGHEGVDEGRGGDEDEDENDDEEEGSYDQMSDAESGDKKTTTTQGFVKVQPPEEPDAFDDEDEEDDDIYDINVVDWDHGMSPLHHAIVSGHEHVVEALVSQYGADCLLPMKKYTHNQSEGKKASDAILTLALPLKIRDVEKRASMTACLLKLGASSAQANSFNNTSAFHYAVLATDLDVLDQMFELDKPGVMSVIDNIAGKRHGRHMTPSQTPLISALINYEKEEFKKMAHYLLDHGAKGRVDLESYVYHLHAEDKKQDSTRQQLTFGGDVMQPIEIAVHLGAYDVITKLVSAGADVSQIIKQTYTEHRWSGTLPVFGKTVLEYLRDKIEQCKKFLENYRDPKQTRWRERIIFGPEVLDDIEPGTYRRYLAEIHLVETNEARKAHNEKGPGKQDDKQIYASQAHKAAVEELLQSYEKTESLLLSLGAKTYHELLPEKKDLAMKEEANRNRENRGIFGSNSPDTWEIERLGREEEEYKKDCIFMPLNQVEAPYLGEGDVQAGYRRLFEAIWRGTPEDAAIVKELTLGPSGEGENKLPALRMAVVDTFGHSTLFVALRNRNWEMAKLIMAIIQEQYEIPEGESAGKRYVLGSDEDGDEDEIRSTEGDNEFTIENIGVRKGLTKCDISPFGYLTADNMFQSRFIDREDHDKLAGTGALNGAPWKWTLLSWAIYKDDMELFRFLLKLADDCEENGANKFMDHSADFSVNPYGTRRGHTRLALTLGRITMLEEIMKTIPFGIPFEELEESDEELQQQKPQFYQGLTVYGTKRKDWASSSYPAYGTESDKKHKPAHVAVSCGNLASIKWLLSERPYECLKEFMIANPNHIRAKILKKQGDGLGFMLQKGLGVETSLLPFLAVKGWFEKYPMETFRFLLSRPGAIEARTNNSLNLALYAVSLTARRTDLVPVLEELLKPEYDADFFARDGKGCNVLHYALSADEIKNMKKVLQMIPKEVHEVGWTQRSLGQSQTPLATWLKRTGGQKLDTLRLILKYSKGRDLGIADVEGNLPLHWAYQCGLPGVLSIFTEMAPQYTRYENANGRTPMEIATSLFLSDVYCNPPEGLPYSWQLRWTAVDRQIYEFYPPTKQDSSTPESPKSMDINQMDEEEEPKDGVTWKVDTTDLVKTYELGVSYLEKYPGKRKLISLNDANELAKRVATMKTKKNEEEDEFDGGDILSFW